MTINPVSPSISSQIGSTQNTPQVASSEVRSGKKNDGDADEGVSPKVSAIAPTVNTSGQTIGTIISVAA